MEEKKSSEKDGEIKGRERQTYTNRLTSGETDRLKNRKKGRQKDKLLNLTCLERKR